MKNIKRRKIFHLLFLLTFLSVTLFINFLHTENTLSSTDDCPACHFVNSTLMTAQINFFFLPPPRISGYLNSLDFFGYTFIAFVTPSSRSPPSV
jgi:hypothetical protein